MRKEKIKRSKHTSSSAQRPTDSCGGLEVVYIRDCQQIGGEFDGEIRKRVSFFLGRLKHTKEICNLQVGAMFGENREHAPSQKEK